ncbi:MAG: NBR1-Ig-like domain-containing protein [Chloroflexota bacterium]
MNKRIRNLLPFAVIAVLFLSACSTPKATPNPTEMIAAIYTAAAETITAKSAQFTATLKPTETLIPSVTPTVIATRTAGAPSKTVAPQNTCDNSMFVADVTIPDKTEMAPGTEFDKTWTVKNTGSCTWSTSYSLIFGSGDLMAGAKTALTQTVAPMQQVNVTVGLTAPLVAGTYTGRWRLVNAAGTVFGESLSVVIVATGDAVTETVTVTPTVPAPGVPTQTATPTVPAPGVPTQTATPTVPVPVVPTQTATPTVPAPVAPTRTPTVPAPVVPTRTATATQGVLVPAMPTGTPTPSK